VAYNFCPEKGYLIQPNGNALGLGSHNCHSRRKSAVGRLTTGKNGYNHICPKALPLG